MAMTSSAIVIPYIIFFLGKRKSESISNITGKHTSFLPPEYSAFMAYSSARYLFCLNLRTLIPFDCNVLIRFLSFVATMHSCLVA